ncbi:site-specific integrase [Pseudonocardia sp. MCCB 268]|nr:site-specific integrase [Pseudonocardia cytotoxica]
MPCDCLRTARRQRLADLEQPQSRRLRRWVDAIPELLDDGVDHSGDRLPSDRTRIYPYAFRHAYAQRHADNGTDIDVKLRELMDHTSISTTQGYFTVSLTAAATPSPPCPPRSSTAPAPPPLQPRRLSCARSRSPTAAAPNRPTSKPAARPA